MSKKEIKVPDHWEFYTLEDINVFNYKSINPAKKGEEKFLYYSIPNYQEYGQPKEVKGSEIRSNKILVEDKCVLYGKLNPRVEKVWLVDNPSPNKLGSTEWLPVKPNNECDLKFLYYLIWSHWVLPIAKEMVSGSTPSRQRVKPSSFYKIKVPIPPKEEQKQIAHILSTIQEAKAKTEAVIEAAQELKKSMMKHLFTYGAVSPKEKRDIELKGAQIGKIPKKWDEVYLGDIFKLTSGKSRPKDITEDGLYNKFPVYGGNGILGYSKEWFNENETIIIGRVGAYCGNVYNTSGKKWITDNALYAKEFYTEINLVYLKTILDFLELNNFKNTGSQPLISQSIVYNQKIPLPTLKEQNQIAYILETLEEKVITETNKKEALNNLFQSTLQQLMTGQLQMDHLKEAV